MLGPWLACKTAHDALRRWKNLPAEEQDLVRVEAQRVLSLTKELTTLAARATPARKPEASDAELERSLADISLDESVAAGVPDGARRTARVIAAELEDAVNALNAALAPHALEMAKEQSRAVRLSNESVNPETLQGLIFMGG